MVWWLRVPASDARGSGPSLVGELGSHMLQGPAPSPTLNLNPCPKERKPIGYTLCGTQGKMKMKLLRNV